MKESRLLKPETPFKNAADHISSSHFKSAPEFNLTAEDSFSRPSRKGITAQLSSFTSNSFGGSSMDRAMHKMEHAYGTDFSNVSIYKDSPIAEKVGAKAFAKGDEIHFAKGQFNPESSNGEQLLGHELAHVVQQRKGNVSASHIIKGTPANFNSSLEQEAERKGIEASKGNSISDDTPKTYAAGNTSEAPIQGFFGEALDWAKKKVSAGVSFVGNTAKKGIDKAKGLGSKVWGGVKKIGSGIWNAGKKGARKLWKGGKKIIDRAGDLKDKVLGGLETLLPFINPITAFANKAAQAILSIISNPTGFLKNLFNAIKDGFGNFFGNIMNHISQGLINWLMSVLSGAGIKLPPELSFSGILSVARQIIETTWGIIRNKILAMVNKIVKKYGPAAGKVVHTIARYGGKIIFAVFEKLTGLQKSKDKTFKMLSSVSQKMHETSKSIIDNMR